MLPCLASTVLLLATPLEGVGEPGSAARDFHVQDTVNLFNFVSFWDNHGAGAGAGIAMRRTVRTLTGAASICPFITPSPLVGESGAS